MANDLTVAQGTTLVLSENPSPTLAPSFQRVQINTFNDLVEQGVIKSQDTVNRLLNSAKEITRATLTRRETYTPFVPVIGTNRPDLRRFGSFLAATMDVPLTESQIFWRLARSIDPQALFSVQTDTGLQQFLHPALSEIIKYLFQDIVVEPNSVLTIGPTVALLTCRDLLIRKAGSIVVQGSVRISAFSIKGEQ